MIAVRFVLALPRNLDPALPNRLQLKTTQSPAKRAEASLWVDEGTPIRTCGPDVYVIGPCFSRYGSSADTAPFDASAKAVAATVKAFMRAYWGSYLLLLFDGRKQQWCLCGDPSGLLPVFRFETSDHIFFATHPALLETASGQKMGVSWSAMRRHLLAPDQRQRETCLQGVEELRPGALLYPATLVSYQDLWRAADHFPEHPAMSFDEAQEELCVAAAEVVTAWSRYFGTTAVAVSGGVDSSLICGALSASELPFGCITLATRDATGDERAFARSLAEHLAAPLAERIYDLSSFNPFVCASTGLPRPSRRAFLAVVDRMLEQGLVELGSNVVFDGNGGDNLFCFLHSAAPVADRVRNEGIGAGSISTLLDMCKLTDCDLPTMCLGTLQRLWRGSLQIASPLDCRLLDPATCEAQVIEPLVDWLEADPGSHKGKRDHVSLLMKAQHHVHGVTSGSPRFSPLMSQPLIETCLRIPTWLWPTGGLNRALARAAFADRLPADILRRKSKAGPDSFIRRAFREHHKQLHDLLRHGHLAANGILDVGAIDRAFAMLLEKDAEMIYRLLDLAEAENWSRTWSS